MSDLVPPSVYTYSGKQILWHCCDPRCYDKEFIPISEHFTVLLVHLLFGKTCQKSKQPFGLQLATFILDPLHVRANQPAKRWNTPRRHYVCQNGFCNLCQENHRRRLWAMAVWPARLLDSGLGSFKVSLEWQAFLGPLFNANITGTLAL